MEERVGKEMEFGEKSREGDGVWRKEEGRGRLWKGKKYGGEGWVGWECGGK